MSREITDDSRAQTGEHTKIGRTQFDLNREVYTHDHIRDEFEFLELRPAEAMLLLRHRDVILDRAVLEIGVGSGRVSRYLHALANSYAGIDLDSGMVERCQRALPGARVEVCDMRDLAAFENASFDTVVASFNVLDAVGHTDRLQALAEVRRVLRPAGYLLFSAHNRDWPGIHAGPSLRRSRNPLTQAVNIRDLLHERSNHRRLRPLEVVRPDYELVNDCAHGYSLLLYYVDPVAQERQLDHAGFDLLEISDVGGCVVPAGARSPRSPDLHYVAKRRPD